MFSFKVPAPRIYASKLCPPGVKMVELVEQATQYKLGGCPENFWTTWHMCVFLEK